MNKATCPKGCGEMEIFESVGGSLTWLACGGCGIESSVGVSEEDALEEASRLCYREVRKRLPTVKEEAAHLVRWGEGAGFMLRSTDPRTVESYRYPTWVTAGHSPALSTLRALADLGVYSLECWAVTAEGRPVGWPPEGA